MNIVSHRSTVGPVHHLLAVFGAPLDSAETSGITNSDGNHLGCDCVWFDVSERADSQDPEELDRTIQRLTQFMELGRYTPEDLTCVSLNPQGSSVAISVGLALEAHSVLALGITPSAEPAIISTQPESKTRLFLFSCSEDPGFQSNEQRLLPALTRLAHFNWIQAKWPTCHTLKDAVRIGKPYWIALLSLLVNGTSIALELPTVIGRLPDSARVAAAQWESGDGVFELSSARFTNKLLHLEGVAFYRGRAVANHSDIHYWLVAESNNRRVRFELGSVRSADYSETYLQNVFIDYSVAGFADRGFSGLSLSALPPDRYWLSVGVKEHERTGEQWLSWVSPEAFTSAIVDDRVCKLHPDTQRFVVLDIEQLRRLEPDEAFVVRVDQAMSKDSRLWIEGRFAVESLPLAHYGQGVYYLVLFANDTQNVAASFRLGLVESDAIDLPFNHNGSHRVTCFADFKHKGVDLSGFPAGDYQASIALVTADGNAMAEIGDLRITDCGIQATWITEKETK